MIGESYQGKYALFTLQQELGKIYNTTKNKMAEKKLTLIKQNSRMKEIQMEKADLDLILTLNKAYKNQEEQQRRRTNLKYLQKTENTMIEKSKREINSVIEETLDESKNMLRFEDDSYKDLKQYEDLFKHRIKQMERSLAAKTRELDLVKTELSKVRGEFEGIIKRMKLLQDVIIDMDGVHTALFIKLKNMASEYIEKSSDITILRKKVGGIKQIIRKNENHFNSEINEIDRVSILQMKFDQFVSVVCKPRDWYSLDSNYNVLVNRLYSQTRQIDDYETSLRLIRETGGNESIREVLSKFRTSQADNFSLFRFLIFIHEELKLIDSEIQFQLAESGKKEFQFVAEKFKLYEQFKFIQKVADEIMKEGELQLKEIEFENEEIKFCRDRLRDIFYLMGKGSEDTDDPFTQFFPKMAIIEINDMIIKLLSLYKVVNRSYRKTLVHGSDIYENHHRDIGPPNMPTFD